MSQIPQVNLAKKWPQILDVWDFEANGFPPDCMPLRKYADTYRFPLVHFICSHGHKWSRKSPKLVTESFRCPVCIGTELLTGFNDLATKRPDLLEFWDYAKNTKRPEETRYRDHANYWWLDKRCGHSYKLSLGYQEKRTLA